MKLNRSYLFIAGSSLALIVLLAIQVNWLLKTAQIKEEFFNEKANMVLSRTTEALQEDQETCRKIGEIVEMDRNSDSPAKLGGNEVSKIDSLFNHFMRYYNFHIDYAFQVVKPGVNSADYGSGFAGNIYNKQIAEAVNPNKFELKLILPDKKQFILAEMGTMFITSVILILVVLILFWRTVLSLLNEKQISEHTTDFLNNMTHEFKTPITNIALAGKMITRDSNIHEADKIKHYSAIILEENEKLRLQVEQVLSMTALERGDIPLNKMNLDFHQIIHDALKHISIQVEHKMGKLNLNLDAKMFLVFGDRLHLTNAVCNLVDNAIKYSKDNPAITIITSNVGHNLVVEIHDNGIGIEKEYHKNVFDKYFRVPTGDVHNVKGFGLGLAYIKKIVELHGGTIELRSEKGKGSTFTITLPYA